MTHICSLYIEFIDIHHLTEEHFPLQDTISSPSMGRQSCDPTIIHSSIALLQERFRQLERAKEMRQQRELLRLFSETEQEKPTVGYEPSKLFFHSELVLPPRQPIKGSLLLQPNMQSKHSDLQVNQIRTPANLCSVDSVMNITNNSDESDVDTSLHL